MAADLEKYIATATLDEVQIRFRNFSGNPGQYNAAGQRNFCVLLDQGQAEAMGADGWNIKYLKPREDGDLPQAYIKVKVNFGGPRPPKVYMVNSRGRTLLDEESVGILDWADFANVDLIISPYKYDVNGNKGVSAYLQTIFATIREDELELRYRDVPDAQDLDTGQAALDWKTTTPGEIEEMKMKEIEGIFDAELVED